MPKRAHSNRVQIGEFWLQWRRDREVWEIAWYDRGDAGRARRVRRLATGCTDRGPGKGPPDEAVKALFDHHANTSAPKSKVTDALVETLLADWLVSVSRRNFDPVRAANCVDQLLRFFAVERAAGKVIGSPRVSDVDRKFCERYIDWRRAQPGRRGKAISGATIDRELAALRSALVLAEKDNVIDRAPRVPSVPDTLKSAPRDIIYSAVEVAKLLEAAARLPERRHVLHFIIIALSTHCRPDALMELNLDEQRNGQIIDFLRPGEVQTRKKRAKVRAAPTLVKWLDHLDGKAIEARSIAVREGKAVILIKACRSIKTAFAACLREAGIVDPVLDEDGKQIFDDVRDANGRLTEIGRTRPRGSPITLKHTIATHLHKFGVPEGQIDVAAGHDGIGTNKRNYRHIRPEYLTDFCRGIEAFWEEVGRHTRIPLLPHCYPKLSAGDARPSRRK